MSERFCNPLTADKCGRAASTIYGQLTPNWCTDRPVIARRAPCVLEQPGARDSNQGCPRRVFRLYVEIILLPGEIVSLIGIPTALVGKLRAYQPPNGFGADGIYQTRGHIARVGINYSVA